MNGKLCEILCLSSKTSRRNTFFISRKAIFLAEIFTKNFKFLSSTLCDRMKSCARYYVYHRKRVAETSFLFHEKRFSSEKFLRKIKKFFLRLTPNRKRVRNLPFLKTTRRSDSYFWKLPVLIENNAWWEKSKSF